MKKTARILYLIIGSIFPISIGLLHTYVHFDELVAPQVQEVLTSNTLIIHGEEQAFWNAWGLISFMMGWSFIIIGLLNLCIYKIMGKESYPPILGISFMILYLLGVLYSSNAFNTMEQFYGSIFGLVLCAVCLFLSIKKA